MSPGHTHWRNKMPHGKSSVGGADLYEAQKRLSEVNYHYWIEDGLFTFNWWFLLILITVPWLIWWKLVDKKRIFEILTMGLLVTGLATVLDATGVSFLLWGYGSKIVQMIPMLIPIDYSVLPVVLMLVYQYFPKWIPYIIVNIIIATGASFVVEPLFVRMNIYHPYNWEYFYSFPIYIAIAIGFKWLVQQLKVVVEKS